MVVVIPIRAVDKMVTQLELHLLGQLGQQGVLSFRGQFGEHEVALRLPLAPNLLEGAGIEHGKGHEVHRVKGFLRIVEIPLGILDARVFLTFLQHLAAFKARQADFFLHAGNDHDQPLLDDLVPRGGKRQDLLQYLAVVIGVLYYYCHCLSV